MPATPIVPPRTVDKTPANAICSKEFIYSAKKSRSEGSGSTQPTPNRDISTKDHPRSRKSMSFGCGKAAERQSSDRVYRGEGPRTNYEKPPYGPMILLNGEIGPSRNWLRAGPRSLSSGSPLFQIPDSPSRATTGHPTCVPQRRRLRSVPFFHS